MPLIFSIRLESRGADIAKVEGNGTSDNRTSWIVIDIGGETSDLDGIRLVWGGENSFYDLLTFLFSTIAFWNIANTVCAPNIWQFPTPETKTDHERQRECETI